MTKDLNMSKHLDKRRDLLLESLVSNVPYVTFLGVEFDRKGDELIAILPFSPKLIGNPALPAIHGGVTASFLEITAIFGLSWVSIWNSIENHEDVNSKSEINLSQKQIPKTIDFTVDYLRPGLPRDAYAKAEVKRAGRRYASVQVEAWQDNRNKLFAQASGHFLMPFNRG
jgi:acyl-coenzyme A thioesterase PaaI-like protein